MNKLMPLGFAAMLALSACGEDSSTAAGDTDTPAATQESSTGREASEALDALREAGRETGDAASAAAEDIQDAAGPVLEQARQAGEDALETVQEGLNDLTRGAACQTSRAAEDAEGIAANC